MSSSRAHALHGAASAALPAALGVALLPGHPPAVVVLLAVCGVASATLLAAPASVRLLMRRRSMLLVGLLAALIVAWFASGVLSAAAPWPQLHAPRGQPLPPFPDLGGSFNESGSWPWRVGRFPLLALALAVLAAGGGLVLIADAVRVQLGLAQPRRSAWRLLTAEPSRGSRVAIRAIPGVGLVALAAFLGISLVSQDAPYGHPLETMLEMVAIGIGAALLIAGPVAIGLSLRLDFDKEGRAREEERRRFAAHLHDSVLQTLALIQRQAADPEAVAKLARRQEHALRAWMAGEAGLSSATVGAALRDMVAEVEDEHGIKVELTAIGDTRLDARGEEMIAAAREALRNAARHAPGAPVNVFLNINGHGIELFVRDGGPGFEFDAVPAERRGLRDAVIGRMGLTGGSATVDSAPGEGTEDALRLPPSARPR